MLTIVQFIAGCLGIIVAALLGFLVYHLKKQSELLGQLSEINDGLLCENQTLEKQVAQLKSERSILLNELNNKKKGKK